jgi:hypothetical protein
MCRQRSPRSRGSGRRRAAPVAAATLARIKATLRPALNVRRVAESGGPAVRAARVQLTR